MARWKDRADVRGRNVSLTTGWTVQNGSWHILNAPTAWAGGQRVNWLRADNVNNDRISHPIPSAVDFAKSIEWRFLFGFNDLVVNTSRFMLFFNQRGVLWNNAGANGYAVVVTSSNVLRLDRITGGGGFVSVFSPGWTSDVLDHEIIVTREVSGANRFWRMYLDRVLVGGPTNDVTYTTGLWMGLNADARDRFSNIRITS